ncbi:threonine/serine exporter family protein [Kitasatospora sp. NPDC088351]|uniref:threonine/serine ThrE exporter family protein n=1 Tax=unclassified Kitasatospora TaxID=2633591 RepID=UPI003436E8A1
MPEQDRPGGQAGAGQGEPKRAAGPAGRSAAEVEAPVRDGGGGGLGPPRPPVGAEAVPDSGPVLPGDAPWLDRMLPLLRTPMAERPAPDDGPLDRGKPGPESAACVLDLALRVGELLLASGEAAEDVEAAMLGIARAYRVYPCEPQVTFTLVSISYQPTSAESPLMVERTVRRRVSDYARLAAVFRLVSDITAGGVDVDDAGRRLAWVRQGRPYPVWLLVLASGLLAGAATVLVGGKADGRAWLVFASAFVAAVAGDRLAALVAHHDLPEFYQFVVAAMPAALIGILLSFNDLHLRGSVVITGGLFAFLPGRFMVAAAQDGLTGFYLTAAARLLEVLYLVAGMVIGVMLVLYVGVSSNADLRNCESPDGVANPPLQLVAAMLVALAFAVLLQTDRSTVPLVVLNSAVGWATYGVLVNALTEPIVAAGSAAGLVGLFGQLMARYRGVSALPYVTAAIGPLMPGSVLYFGLLSFTQGRLDAGLASVGRASATAMALAIGVNLGGEVARLFKPLSNPEPARGARRCGPPPPTGPDGQPGWPC